MEFMEKIWFSTSTSRGYGYGYIGLLFFVTFLWYLATYTEYKYTTQLNPTHNKTWHHIIVPFRRCQEPHLYWMLWISPPGSRLSLLFIQSRDFSFQETDQSSGMKITGTMHHSVRLDNGLNACQPARARLIGLNYND